MKRVLKLLLLFTILCSSLFASIDEYKSDLYYANGIMMNDSEEKATEIWQIKIEEVLKNKQESYKKLEKIQNSYNRSQFFFDDLFESLEQKMSNEFGWKQLTAYVTAFLTTHNIQEDWRVHGDDLDQQVKNYKQSIRDGHGVIVIAHSQGNYYTNEAYEELDEWMKEYFHMFGVATPANHVAGFKAGDTTAPYVLFHNDFINSVIGGLDSNREDIHHGGFPNIIAHDFYNSYLSNEETKNDIVNFIESKIQEQVDAQSQWAVDEEIEKGTKEFKVTLTHIYNDAQLISQMKDVKVYPFAPSKKLYQVQDPLKSDDKEKKVYVKASFGGERILDAELDAGLWEAKENQFYKLEGTDPVEYIEAMIVYLQVSRSSSSISSVKLYMTDGIKSILVYPRDVDVHGSGEGGGVKEFSLRDGTVGTPSNTYDRYLDSKWVGTIYEGKFNDTVLATLPFSGFVEGFWCNNTHGGDCKRDDNFPTYYTLSNNGDSNYLNNIYEDNF